MEFMKDFYRVAGEQSDALFEMIYSFLGCVIVVIQGKLLNIKE